jgi:hypothetical protein
LIEDVANFVHPKIQKSVIKQINSGALCQIPIDQLLMFLGNKHNDGYILNKYYEIKEQLSFTWLYRPNVSLNVFILQTVQTNILPDLMKIIAGIKFDKFNQLEYQYQFLVNNELVASHLRHINNKITKVVNVLTTIGEFNFDSPEYCLKQLKVNLVLATLFQDQMPKIGKVYSQKKFLSETEMISLLIFKPNEDISQDKFKDINLTRIVLQSHDAHIIEDDINNYILQSGDTNIQINMAQLIDISKLSDAYNTYHFQKTVSIIFFNIRLIDFKSYMSSVHKNASSQDTSFDDYHTAEYNECNNVLLDTSSIGQ